MTLVTEVLYEDAERRVVREYDDEQPEEERTIITRSEWKPGSRPANRQMLLSRLELAETYFGEAYADWDTLTAAQKDVRMKQAMRALSNLCRMLGGAFESGGV
jgi:hypothetical protein